MPTPPGRAPSERHVFVFLLLDGFSMMSLASAIEPLRSFNRLHGRDVFGWRLAGVGGGAVQASNGLFFPTVPAGEALAGAEILFVCGGLRVKPDNERAHHAVLRQAARLNIALGALSTGGYLLARAGLLNGYRCTIHWENRMAFREEFPEINCTDKIYEIDRNRLTCSGAIAAMDLMLRLIGDEYGRDIAQRVANQFHHDRIRDEEEEQRGGRADQRRGFPPMLRAAIRLMEGQQEDPLTIKEVADQVGIGVRQMERLFQQHTGSSPVRYYIVLRIRRAHELLLYSDQPVLDVAVATGFSSISHLSHWFRRVYGLRPSEFRRNPPAQRVPR